MPGFGVLIKKEQPKSSWFMTHLQQLKAFFVLFFLKNVMISMGEYGISKKLW